jgi:hypothetical protein
MSVRRTAGVALLAIIGLEVLSYLVILLARPVLIDPIRSPRQRFAAQSVAVRRFLAGDRDFWAFDPVTGWRWPPHYRNELYVTNSAGLLGARENQTAKPAGKVRVSAFGNSFVVGADIPTDSSWTVQLERQQPRLEVINYGVAAFGNDQSLLQYLTEGRTLKPDIVLIGLAADNLKRNENIFRRFLTPQAPPLAKPRFLLGADGRLTLLPNPLRRVEDMGRFLDEPAAVTELGRHDAYYQPVLYENTPADWSATARVAGAVWARVQKRWLEDEPLYRGERLNPRSSGFALGVALMQAFADSVRKDGALALIVSLPSRASYESTLSQEPAELAVLVDTLRRRGLDVVELTDALLADPAARDPARLFTRGAHYTPYGSAAIARWLGPQILKRTGERP